jgi:hypothetical protein
MEYEQPNNKSIEELLYDCCDNIDPISQSDLWIIENGNKKIIYPKENYDNLRFYYESDTILRCFEIESLKFLKTYNINKHPISSKIIPEFMFYNIIEFKKEDVPITILANEVFKLFNDSFIYIEHDLFLSLNINKLLRFYNEFKSLWNENITIEIKNEITHDILNNSDIINSNLIDIQRYLLNQMKILLEYQGSHKTLVIHIIIASLSIIIPELQTDNFIFDFAL